MFFAKKSNHDIVYFLISVNPSRVENIAKILSKQNVNKATKVMMDLQKPLKKFYEKKSSKITKEMVDEFINIAKNNADFTHNKFVDEYLK